MAAYLLLSLVALRSLHQVFASPTGFSVQDARPKYPYDPSTTPYCTWWWDNDGSFSCAEVLEAFDISMEDFARWNPSLAVGCSAYKVSTSYCIDATGEPPVTVTSKAPSSSSTRLSARSTSSTTTSGTSTITTLTSSKTSSLPPSTTTTSAGNGIATPTPRQPTMVDNCKYFYWVKPGETCSSIAALTDMWIVPLTLWNNCDNLWANAWMCVGIAEVYPTTTRVPTPSPTKPPSGIQTPQPMQPDMVAKCNQLYWAKQGDSCDSISRITNVWVVAITLWNPRTMADCSGLWANAWSCIGVDDLMTVPDPPANGVQLQPDMVSNCNRLYWVKPGDTCDSISRITGVWSVAITLWNPRTMSDCSGLWANAWACVGVA